MMSLEDKTLGEARSRLLDVCLGAELLELPEGVLEQPVGVVEPTAPGHYPAEVRRRHGNADPVIRRAPDPQRLLEQSASLVELTPVGEDLSLRCSGLARRSPRHRRGQPTPRSADTSRGRRPSARRSTPRSRRCSATRSAWPGRRPPRGSRVRIVRCSGRALAGVDGDDVREGVGVRETSAIRRRRRRRRRRAPPSSRLVEVRPAGSFTPPYASSTSDSERTRLTSSSARLEHAERALVQLERLGVAPPALARRCLAFAAGGNS